VQTSYTFAPFGATTSTGQTNTNPFKFTGREDDGTGLYYYRARYYHPGLQRFVSEDPIGFAGGDWNLYAYVRNGLVRYRDPFGLALDDWTGFPTGDEHRNRNYYNRCPPNPPPTGSKSSDGGSDRRKWRRDLVYGAYRTDDGSECYYDAKGNHTPGAGTYNYGGGRFPELSPRHWWKDVLPHFWYGGDYTIYNDSGGPP
jgi:RHS repeat-associated protein